MHRIFVFGSNKAGRHGKGAAYYAKQKHGAIYGIGEGLQGTSYALPTKDKNLNTLSEKEVKECIDTFITFAKRNKDLTFELTPVGLGLAGLSKKFVVMCIKNRLPENVVLSRSWLDYVI